MRKRLFTAGSFAVGEDGGSLVSSLGEWSSNMGRCPLWRTMEQLQGTEQMIPWHMKDLKNIILSR